MALQAQILEKGFLQLILNPPQSAQEYAFRFSTFYAQFAMTATPTPILTSNRSLLEKNLQGAFADPRTGSSRKGISGIRQGLGGFWLLPGTIPAATIVLFTGGSAMGGCLNSKLRNPKIPAQQAAKSLAQCHLLVTQLVSYFIPPGPALFLV
jgi:hypothetical protein